MPVLDKAATMTGAGEITYVSFPIEKTETTPEGDLVVYGKATDGSVDSDDQIVDPKFAAEAIPEWLATGGNLRVQHNAQRDPAGVGIDTESDGQGAQWVKSLVVEPVAIKLVERGALRAYSVGIARPTIVRDAMARGGRIVGGQIVEISLVDRPANKNCGIQLVKAAQDGHAEWVGKMFGSDDFIAKAAGETVTLELPADVNMTFTPADMARVLASKGVRAVKNGKDDDDDDDDDCDMGKAETGILGKGHRKFSAEQRRQHASQGQALPDGSYPIPDKDALRRAAILARSKHGNWKAARRLIARRARELGVDNPMAKFVQPAGTTSPHGIRNMGGGGGKPQGSDAETGKPKKGKKKDKWIGSTIHSDPMGASNTAPNVRLHDGAKKPHGIMMGKPKKKGKKAVIIGDPAEKKLKVACPHCGAIQNPGHVFCTECGAKVPESAMEVEKNHDYLCLGCQTLLDKGEAFCPQCGKSNPGYLPEADHKIPANKMLYKGKGKKKKGNFRVPTSPGEGVTGAHTAPAPSDLGEFAGGTVQEDMIDPHGAEMKAAWRLKNAGAPRDIGVLHDLACPAFTWDDVLKVHPEASFANIDQHYWQQKAIDAATASPLAEAGALSRLWQHAVTLKTSGEPELRAVKFELNKAFQDANPGPGTFPSPGELSPGRYNRPYISEGHSSASPGQEGPNDARVPSGGISASGYRRGYLDGGHASESPSGSHDRPLSSPDTPGIPGRTDYQMVKDGNARQAMVALHDHIAYTFPDLCPMSDPIGSGPESPRSVPVAKQDSTGSSDPGGDGGDDGPPWLRLKKPKKGKGKKVKKALREKKKLQLQIRKLQKDAKTSGKPLSKQLQAQLTALKAGLAKSTLSGKELRQSMKPVSKQLAAAIGSLRADIAQGAAVAGDGNGKLAKELRKSRRQLDKKFRAQQQMLMELSQQQPQPGAPAPDLAPLKAASKQLAAELRQSRREYDRLSAERKRLAKAERAVAQQVAASPEMPEATAKAMAETGKAIRKGNKALAAELRQSRKQLDKRFAAQQAMISQLATPAVTADPGTAQKADTQVREASRKLAAELRQTRKQLNGKFREQRRRMDALASQPDPVSAWKAAEADVRKAGEQTVNEVRTALMQVLSSPALNRGEPQPTHQTVLPPFPQSGTKKLENQLKAVQKNYKAQARKQAKAIKLLTQQRDALAGQPDSSIHAFKGVAADAFKMQHNGNGVASGAQALAEDVARTQNAMLQELQNQFRTSPDPVAREAAWRAITKMRGLSDS